jgi:uncharacterized protein YraI
MTNAMKTLRVAAAAGLGLLALSAAPASAATYNGYVTANVNERSGPSTSYPAITVIPAGSPITIYGCLADGSWCDISWGPNRGWMSAAYLQVNYQSHRVPVRGFTGIPYITFNFGSYWDSHYRNRPFFNQKNKWSGFHWQQPGNNNPPPMPPQPPKPNKPPFPKPSQGMGNQNGNQPPFVGGNKPPFGNGNKPPMYGQGKPPMYGKGNGQYGPPKNPPPGKDCKWVNGQWVCTAPNP